MRRTVIRRLKKTVNDWSVNENSILAVILLHKNKAPFFQNKTSISTLSLDCKTELGDCNGTQILKKKLDFEANIKPQTEHTVF